MVDAADAYHFEQAFGSGGPARVRFRIGGRAMSISPPLSRSAPAARPPWCCVY